MQGSTRFGDVGESDDPLEWGRWTAQLRSSLRGRRTQALLVETVAVDARYLDQLEASHAALQATLRDIAGGRCFDPGEGGCLGTCLTCKARAALVHADALPKRED